MKYALDYLREALKINPLGILKLEPCIGDEDLGECVYIDDIYTGLKIWYRDYSNWMDNKLECAKKQSEEDKKLINNHKIENMKNMARLTEMANKSEKINYSKIYNDVEKYQYTNNKGLKEAIKLNHNDVYTFGI